jgi:hypothetical protein
MSSSKKFTCKGTLLQVFIDWRYSRSCWYFRPSFVKCCPSNLLSGSTPLPPPPASRPCVKVQYSLYRKCVAGRGWGILSPVRDHKLQEFNTLFLTRFRTYTKFLADPKQRPRSGGGLRQINTCRKVPLQVNFLDDNILLWYL